MESYSPLPKSVETVKDLRVNGEGLWNHKVIRSIYHKDTSKQIMGTPFSTVGAMGWLV